MKTLAQLGSFASLRRRGSGWLLFTLVELLVVIAIIILLLSILLPSLGTAKSYAKSIECKNRLRQFMIGEGAYAGDYNGAIGLSFGPASGQPWIPWHYFLFGDIAGTQKYLPDKGIISCPSVKSRYSSSDQWNCYGGNIHDSKLPAIPPSGYYRIFCRLDRLTSLNILVADTGRPSGGVMKQWYYFRHDAPWESNALHARHQNRVNLSFADGHVESADRQTLIVRYAVQYMYSQSNVLLGP